MKIRYSTNCAHCCFFLSQLNRGRQGNSHLEVNAHESCLTQQGKAENNQSCGCAANKTRNAA